MSDLKQLTEAFEEAGYDFPQSAVVMLQAFLQDTDEHALKSVKQNIGGPFGARFVVVTKDGKIHPVGNNVGNAVVSSGIASRHAEHENWTQNWDALVQKLEELSGQQKMLIELSSGESCINCHSKQEVGINTLYAAGLLDESTNDQASVIFGASYRQTADVAGFNDLVYLLALQNIKNIELNAGTHNPITDSDIAEGEELAKMYSHTSADIRDIPPAVAKIFNESDKAVVVIVKDGEVFATGNDERDTHFSRTPEVVALQNACSRQRDEFDIFESWDLGGAQIYTSTMQVGPLMLAEGYWSNALDFVTVEHAMQGQWSTQELPGMTNGAFLERIAQHDYDGNKSGTAVRVYHSPTENNAQKFWRDKDDAVNYDGAKAGNSLE